MRLLGCEQINLNLSKKFVETYIQKQNKKKEAKASFQEMLENEQKRLEELEDKRWKNLLRN